MAEIIWDYARFILSEPEIWLSFHFLASRVLIP